jgi:hypothetical protein
MLTESQNPSQSRIRKIKALTRHLVTLTGLLTVISGFITALVELFSPLLTPLEPIVEPMASFACTHLWEDLPWCGKWITVGSGDCTGGDEGLGSQGDTPVPGRCTTLVLKRHAVTAVCWDGKNFNHPLGVWCTYKRTAAAQCANGGTRGAMFRCEPP